MMQEMNLASEEAYDSFDEPYDRPTERWAPLGAPNPDPPHAQDERAAVRQLEDLEEEQEELNQALFSLTSHFAQVQLRLKQIVQAPTEDKEQLLKELEQFAFVGVPDINACKSKVDQVTQHRTELSTVTQSTPSTEEHQHKLHEQQEKQQELINQLKSQLQELESYAYQTGARDNLPTEVVLEKQTAIIDQLQRKLNLDIDTGLNKLSPKELQDLVDSAIGEIVNPAKVKEKMVEQLKTQVVDLERFIQFLQGDATSPGPLGVSRCTCSCPMHKDGSSAATPCPSHGFRASEVTSGAQPTTSPSYAQQQNFQARKSATRRALNFLQLFMLTQFGCGIGEFKKNVLKQTTKANHWGDLRAATELAIEKVHSLAKSTSTNDSDTDDAFFAEPEPAQLKNKQKLTTAVRKELAPTLRDLIQHGLVETSSSSALVPFSCFPARSGNLNNSSVVTHAWQLLLKYYDMKHGREYNESPARKLSQAFGLDMVGGKAITAKQTFLGAIDSVLSTHELAHKGDDSKFKAFVCIALNQQKLATWLRLLFRTQAIIDNYYQGWSYASRTGFEDCCKSLEKLQLQHFDLHVNLTVRRIQTIKDAF